MSTPERVAIVTGGGSGIGRAICARFVRQGTAVGVVDVSGAEKEVAADLGPLAMPAHADVSSEEDVAEAVRLVAEHYGGLDVVCNNAAITVPPTNIADTTLEEYERVQGIDARSVLLGTKHGAEAILRTGRPGGAIVNTASTASFLALPGRGSYSAAKGAVAMLTRVAAIEYAPRGLRVNAVAPGPTRTGIYDAALAVIPDVEERMAATVPLGRTCDPDEIAAVAVFLAGSEASFVTGAVVPVDGGVTVVHPI